MGLREKIARELRLAQPEMTERVIDEMTDRILGVMEARETTDYFGKSYGIGTCAWPQHDPSLGNRT